MTSFRVPRARDVAAPTASQRLSITLDGEPFDGLAGQTIAGVLMGAGRMAWRTTSVARAPRGVFCGIGVCFDCVAEVNRERDVRLCQRRAVDGDVVRTQEDPLPDPVEQDEGERSA